MPSDRYLHFAGNQYGVGLTNRNNDVVADFTNNDLTSIVGTSGTTSIYGGEKNGEPTIKGLDKVEGVSAAMKLRNGGFGAAKVYGVSTSTQLGNASGPTRIDEYAAFVSSGNNNLGSNSEIKDAYGLLLQNGVVQNSNVGNKWGWYTQSGMTNVSAGPLLIGEAIFDDNEADATLTVRGGASTLLDVGSGNMTFDGDVLKVQRTLSVLDANGNTEVSITGVANGKISGAAEISGDEIIANKTLKAKAQSGQTDPLLSLQDVSENTLITDQVSGNRKYHTAGSGIILTSPDGNTTKRVHLDNSGNLTTTTV